MMKKQNKEVFLSEYGYNINAILKLVLARFIILIMVIFFTMAWAWLTEFGKPALGLISIILLFVLNIVVLNFLKIDYSINDKIRINDIKILYDKKGQYKKQQIAIWWEDIVAIEADKSVMPAYILIKTERKTMEISLANFTESKDLINEIVDRTIEDKYTLYNYTFISLYEKINNGTLSRVKYKKGRHIGKSKDEKAKYRGNSKDKEKINYFTIRFCKGKYEEKYTQENSYKKTFIYRIFIAASYLFLFIVQVIIFAPDSYRMGANGLYIRGVLFSFFVLILSEIIHTSFHRIMLENQRITVIIKSTIGDKSYYFNWNEINKIKKEKSILGFKKIRIYSLRHMQTINISAYKNTKQIIKTIIEQVSKNESALIDPEIFYWINN